MSWPLELRELLKVFGLTAEHMAKSERIVR